MAARGDEAIVIAQYFQPLHRGHREVFEQALASGSEVVLLCLGGAVARSPQHPFTERERLAGLHAMAAARARTHVRALRDVPYQLRRWREQLHAVLPAVCASDARIRVISDVEPAPPFPSHWTRQAPRVPLAATEAVLREQLLWRDVPERAVLGAFCDAAQSVALDTFMAGADYATLREEAAFIRKFRASWATAPYPPVFVTTDAVVTWRDRIVLIERAHAPGRGLWALPGGFIDVNETLAACARREMCEETGLVLAPEEQRASALFDAPQRSLRGRTITHAYHYALDGRARLPALRAGDDAARAFWVARESVRSEQLFEDHYAILQRMLGFE